MSLIPSEYFQAFVLGNLEDFKQNPGCLRRAFNVSVSATHMTDHYFSYNRRRHPELVAAWKDVPALGEHISKLTGGAYKDIKSIANAYKHLYESSKGKGHQWTVASGGSVECVDFSSVERRLKYLGHDVGDESDYGEAIMFRRRDGTRGQLLPAIEQVVEYWMSTLWPEPRGDGAA